MLIKLKDPKSADVLVNKLIDAINELDEVWDSDDAISADVITDEDLYDDPETDEDEGVSSCTIIAEIPNADISLMLVQDEDDEDIWYVAKCNYSDEDPRAIDEKYEISEESSVI